MCTFLFNGEYWLGTGSPSSHVGCGGTSIFSRVGVCAESMYLLNLGMLYNFKKIRLVFLGKHLEDGVRVPVASVSIVFLI